MHHVHVPLKEVLHFLIYWPKYSQFFHLQRPKQGTPECELHAILMADAVELNRSVAEVMSTHTVNT